MQATEHKFISAVPETEHRWDCKAARAGERDCDFILKGCAAVLCEVPRRTHVTVMLQPGREERAAL